MRYKQDTFLRRLTIFFIIIIHLLYTTKCSIIPYLCSNRFSQYSSSFYFGTVSDFFIKECYNPPCSDPNSFMFNFKNLSTKTITILGFLLLFNIVFHLLPKLGYPTCSVFCFSAKKSEFLHSYYTYNVLINSKKDIFHIETEFHHKFMKNYCIIKYKSRTSLATFLTNIVSATQTNNLETMNRQRID